MTTTSSPDSSLRIGICGSGITVRHIEGYQKLAGVVVEAIAGPDVDRCRAVAARFGIPHVFSDHKDMLALGLDAVSIAVPNAYHAPLTLDALAAGCHVLLEKPLADSLENAEKIVQAARSSDRIVMLAYNRRYLANSVVLRDLIDKGTLGEIYYARARWSRRAGIPGFGGWFTTKALSGGGPLIDLGVHVLDLALYMMDFPRPVAVSGATYNALGSRGKGILDYSLYGTRPVDPTTIKFDVEDFASGFIRFDNGATLTLEASWAGYQELRDDIALSLYGREGGARIFMPDYKEEDSLRVVTELNGALIDAAPVLPRLGQGGFEHEVAMFVQCVRSGAQPPATVEQGLDILRILDGLYRSAEAGREIELAQ